MFSILLGIIYMAFISLGLPDSLVGSAWPVMQTDFNVPVSYVGIITMIIAGGTVLSSLLSDRLTRKLGTVLVTAVSVFLTAAALFGFSMSGSFGMLCLWSIPYGIGAGAVDAALNNYVALNYSSRHMNWLHCCWGIGAAISPNIMSLCLFRQMGWNSGFLTVAIIQMVLTVLLFLSLPIWKINNKKISNDIEKEKQKLGIVNTLKIRGVWMIIIVFFCYSSVESTAGIWATSYLVGFRKINSETASAFASLFFIGITVGRFLCGFISDKLGDRVLIRTGIAVIVFGTIFIILPTPNLYALLGLAIVGLGCSPIYPAIIHSTPTNFGSENSQAVIGIQMASAYMGTTFMPSVFGLIANHINIGLYPTYLVIFVIVMLIMSEKLNRTVDRKL